MLAEMLRLGNLIKIQEEDNVQHSVSRLNLPRFFVKLRWVGSRVSFLSLPPGDAIRSLCQRNAF